MEARHLSAGAGSGPNPVTQMLRRHRLIGLRSAEKFVPDAIFGLGDEQTRSLPRRHVRVRRACLLQRPPRPDRLHDDQRAARPGCPASAAATRDRGDDPHAEAARLRRDRQGRPRGPDHLAREPAAFLRAGRRSRGRKRRKPRVLERLDEAPRSTNTDTLPVEIWDDVLLAKGDRILGRGQRANRSSAQPQLARRCPQSIPWPRRRARDRDRVSRLSKSSPTPTSGGTKSSRSSTSAKKRPTTSTCPACGTSSPTT